MTYYPATRQNTGMSKFIDYNKVIDQAMRSIVRKCLRFVLKKGGKLPGNHHFYITFNIDYDGVEISETLRKMHSEQMTIVMQHQFWNLTVEDEWFSVELSFNNVREKLVVPYDSLISFADPSARFGLQFHDENEELILPDDDEEIDEELLESLLELGDDDFNDVTISPSETKKPKKKTGDEDDGSKVISIDSFRKK